MLSENCLFNVSNFIRHVKYVNNKLKITTNPGKKRQYFFYINSIDKYFSGKIKCDLHNGIFLLNRVDINYPFYTGKISVKIIRIHFIIFSEQ